MTQPHTHDAGPQVDIQKYVGVIKRQFAENVANIMEQLAMTTAVNEALQEENHMLRSEITRLAQAAVPAPAEETVPAEEPTE